MKAVGALLILAACLCGAALRTRLLREHIRALTAWLGSLERMEAELKTRALPLPVLMHELSREQNEASGFFSLLSDSLAELGERSFRALWERACDRSLGSLQRGEREALRALGAALGRYPLPQQEAALRRSAYQLRGALTLAQRRYADERRLTWGICAAAAFLLWILLL